MAAFVGHSQVQADRSCSSWRIDVFSTSDCWPFCVLAVAASTVQPLYVMLYATSRSCPGFRSTILNILLIDPFHVAGDRVQIDVSHAWLLLGPFAPAMSLSYNTAIGCATRPRIPRWATKTVSELLVSLSTTRQQEARRSSRKTRITRATEKQVEHRLREEHARMNIVTNHKIYGKGRPMQAIRIGRH